MDDGASVVPTSLDGSAGALPPTPVEHAEETEERAVRVRPLTDLEKVGIEQTLRACRVRIVIDVLCRNSQGDMPDPKEIRHLLRVSKREFEEILRECAATATARLCDTKGALIVDILESGGWRTPSEDSRCLFM